MKKNNTKAAYELYLNELYADTYGYEQAMEEFEYLTVKGRNGGHCSSNAIATAYNNHTLGTLQRKYDPISFECGYSDWK